MAVRGSDRGGERAAAMYTLIATAKLNDINPRSWLADVLARIADHPASRLDELLPWHWKARQDLGLAVQRAVVGIFRDDDMGNQLLGRKHPPSSATVCRQAAAA